MKIYSYNVNGIRSALKKGLFDWILEARPDVLCLQELKAQEKQVDLEMIKEAGYRVFWHSAEKKGYSGVAILSKVEPDHIEIGSGMENYDHEGRIIRMDYKDISIMSLYVPSGTTGDVRQSFKMKFLDDFLDYIKELKTKYPNLVVSGDFNICHKPIDIHNPVSNKNSSGFLPEEREWVSRFIEAGFIDTFRFFNKEPHHYTWWSFRANARTRNLGWRIDYHMASENMKSRLKKSEIYPEVIHSDHCPLMLEVD